MINEIRVTFPYEESLTNPKVYTLPVADEEDEVYPVGNPEWWDSEDKDPRGHISHEFRAQNFSKVKRAKNRKLNKLARKARR